MNEKIKQLQNTAGIQVVRTLMRGDENTEVKLMLTQTQLDRFAELIVRECMNICRYHPSGIVSNNWRADDVAQDIMRQFEEHFGVEE